MLAMPQPNTMTFLQTLSPFFHHCLDDCLPAIEEFLSSSHPFLLLSEDGEGVLHSFRLLNQKKKGILLIKPPLVDSAVALEDQLSIVHVPKTSLQSLVQMLSPFMSDNPMVMKRLAELETSLVQSENDAIVPRITLEIHPAVAMVASFEEIKVDPNLLNELQSCVNGWIKKVQQVTSLEPEVASPLSEISFWTNMESALTDVVKQLESDGVKWTLDTLKAAKRFHATVSFIADTGVKEAMERVHKYNFLLKDMPVDAILSSVDLEGLGETISAMFAHINKKLKLTTYPIRRILPLVEAISRETTDRILRIISSKRLMQAPYAKFEALVESIQNVFFVWNDNAKEFVNVCREVTRKRSEKFIPIRLTYAHVKLEERIQFLAFFRSQHENLERTIHSVGLDAQGWADIKQAYEACVNGVDVLDLSGDGDESWIAAETVYNERVVNVENKIIVILRDRLGSAKNANEMFRVFEKFNALFVRPKIRGAIQEYQNQLLANVKDSIQALHEKFRKSFQRSSANKLSVQTRDIPTIAGSIMWAKQIERQLDNYTKKVEAVLGDGWELYAEGSKFKEDNLQFKAKLDTRAMYETWLKEMSDKDNLHGPIFVMSKARNGSIALQVSYDASTVNVFKEVRHLQWIGYSVPHAIQTLAKDAKRAYPFAVSLTETLTVYNAVGDYIKKDSTAFSLLSAYIKQVYDLIALGFNIEWQHLIHAVKDHSAYLSDLTEAVGQLHAKLHMLIYVRKDVEKSLQALKEAKYALLSKHMELIQKSIDALSLDSFSNLNDYVNSLNEEIKQMLTIRLKDMLAEWICVLNGGSSENLPKFQPIHLEIKVKSRVMHLDPPVEYAKQNVFSHLKECMDAITNLPVIKSDNYDMNSRITHYKFDEAIQFVNETFGLIENRMNAVKEYTTVWLQYQSLWDLEPSMLYAKLTTLAHWLELVLNVIESRVVFDVNETVQSFGCTSVHYESVQLKVTAKYDQWQSEIIQRFAVQVQEAMKDFFDLVKNYRLAVENYKFTSTSEIVKAVSGLEWQERMNWETTRDQLIKSVKLIKQNRFKFPNEWLHIELLEGEWTALCEIHLLKHQYVQQNKSEIVTKLADVKKELELSVASVSEDWNREKPTSGSHNTFEALKTLNAFDNKVSELKQENDLVKKANVSLEMNMIFGDIINVVYDELNDMKKVWLKVHDVFAKLHAISQEKWAAVDMRKFKLQSKELQSELDSFDVYMKSYSCYEHLYNQVKVLIGSFTLLSDFKSECIQERHWNELLRKSDNITMNDVMQQVMRNKQGMVNVLSNAQGEFTLQSFIRNLAATYTSASLEYKTFSNTKIVTNFSLLLDTVIENLNSLSQMKHSLHFKVFEKEALEWESKLNDNQILIEFWMNVQRQFVYLSGIFNEQVKQILPVEFSKFQTISSELHAIVKQAMRNSNLQSMVTFSKQLNRLNELLSKLQKSLNVYLDRQRQLFPRFYFVSDEDLLLIISNQLSDKHYKKMFNGIHSVDVTEKCISVKSVEGEVVELSRFMWETPINFLIELEKNLKLKLRHLLGTLLGEFNGKYSSFDDFVKNLAKYPLQVILLSLNCVFTERTKDDTFASEIKNLQLELTRLHCADPLLQTKRTIVLKELIYQEKNFRNENVLKYYFNSAAKTLVVKCLGNSFDYDFEYYGSPQPIVTTKLTTECYCTMTQALSNGLGGSPFGQAGTGKTETVKALGMHLGRFVLVFCCDEHFDYQSIGRIFNGLSQIGGWLCFDEFNRLEERILSAVSQQIHTIQYALKHTLRTVELLDTKVNLNQNTSIFITMNPGYAGRHALPDNLQRLFKSIAMTKPDKINIAHVTLSSLGFSKAEGLARKICTFFDIVEGKLTHQSHYDFGLRALKSVLTTAGNVKRSSKTDDEEGILIRAVMESMLPKLVKEDVLSLKSSIIAVFTRDDYEPFDLSDINSAVKSVSKELHFYASEEWLEKILQIYLMQRIHHGVMLVGPSGVGKTSSWNVVLKAMERLDTVKSVSYVIQPKTIGKDALFGTLDSMTRDWTDGIFTTILRRIIDNARNELEKRHWIVFDGDVDPEWVENLNSLLDDNRVLTLPNGERLALPEQVRILFEVKDLKYATPATVSRCGMIWYSHAITANMMLVKSVANLDISLIEEYLMENGFVLNCLEFALNLEHCMPFGAIDGIAGFVAMIQSLLRQSADASLDGLEKKSFLEKSLLGCIMWAFVGSCLEDERTKMDEFIRRTATCPLPPGLIMDYYCSTSDQEWYLWERQVPSVEVETDAITRDVIIPTVDTVRHESLLYNLLQEQKPMILCGKPGSGKTMTLLSALRKLPETRLVFLNFSSETSVELVLRCLEQNCVYSKTAHSTTLSPEGRLVIFCDEINLPQPDTYGTQRIISFLRELLEKNGFYHPKLKVWVNVERVQLVGACNPPTDPGRHPLCERFLRHASVIYVAYPSPVAMYQIYSAFNSAILKVVPSLRVFAEPLTRAMIEFYLESQKKLSHSQPHYVYSPREATRWARGIYDALLGIEDLNNNGLARLWAHEALRLFHDRLVSQEERDWTDSLLDSIAASYFRVSPKSLERPILYSNWTTKSYVPVDKDEMKQFIRARLQVFYEEESDVEIVMFDHFVDHALRMDRVFRQVQGHLLMIGISGSGKATLTRFVAWMNGMSIFQLSFHNKYSLEDFDSDLRALLKRVGKGEKLCFLVDESNVRGSGFLERMNTLLANGEVPGLFEGEEHAALMSMCKDANGEGLVEAEDLYKWFIGNVVRNLHVVFTMNPPSDLVSSTTTSPALFNRCVVDWFGEWSETALRQVAVEQTKSLDLVSYNGLDRNVLLDAMVYFHSFVKNVNSQLAKPTLISSSHFLDFMQFMRLLFGKQQQALIEQQLHLNVGLDKLAASLEQVAKLRVILDEKKKILNEKNNEANQKLKIMVANQQEAESKRVESVKMQQVLKEKTAEIKLRQKQVMEQLAEAEPAVIEAQQSVSSIKKQHLTEIRSMTNPPDAVKMAMESVCAVLGHRVENWKAVQGIIRRDDFISSIVNYDTIKNMNDALRLRIENEFLSKPAYNFESIQRASKACGPLVMWVMAQVKYSSILDQVGPLREEVKTLTKSAQNIKDVAEDTNKTIDQLEERIQGYKEEYAVLISQTELLKQEMDKVKNKVERSLTLLQNLSVEQERWQVSRSEFNERNETLTGDVLVGAAFLAYGGYFDQVNRMNLVDGWISHLMRCQVPLDVNLNVLDFLCSLSDRLKWESFGLPRDSVCMENIAILDNAKRYPLIIDPSGQAMQFFSGYAKNAVITRFQDPAFQKKLESGMRFGHPVIIEKVEHVDPLIYPLLSHQVTRAAGRVIVKLGKYDVDLSPQFKLVLVANSAIQFPPTLLCRVTLINFTVTSSVVQSHFLDSLLSAHFPDIHSKRSEMMHFASETEVQLFALEKRLLDILNDCGDALLEDEKTLNELEDIKSKASTIVQKRKESEQIMATLDATVKRYSGVLECVANVYELISLLAVKHSLYQFSFEFFVLIVADVLKECGNIPNAIKVGLIKKTYARVSLLRKDKIEFGRSLLLAAFDDEKYNEIKVDNETTLDEFFGSDTPTSFERDNLILICGYDNIINTQSTRTGVKLQSVALGSKESVSIANDILGVAKRTGDWVVIKNIHLAQDFVPTILSSVSDKCKIFVTSTIDSDLPVSFVSKSRVCIFEYNTIANNYAYYMKAFERIDDPPKERKELYTKCIELFCILVERRVYNLFRKPYSFSDHELNFSIQIMDQVIDAFGNRTNVKVDWDWCRWLLSKVYSDIIDDAHDRRVLAKLAEQLFKGDLCALNVDYSVYKKEKQVKDARKAVEAEHVIDVRERSVFSRLLEEAAVKAKRSVSELHLVAKFDGEADWYVAAVLRNVMEDGQLVDKKILLGLHITPEKGSGIPCYLNSKYICDVVEENADEMLLDGTYCQIE